MAASDTIPNSTQPSTTATSANPAQGQSQRDDPRVRAFEAAKAKSAGGPGTPKEGLTPPTSELNKEASGQDGSKKAAQQPEVDRSKAVTALQRARVPEALRKLAETDDEIRLWAESELAATQAAQDRLYQQVKKYSEPKEAADPAQQTGEPAGKPGEVSKQVDLLAASLVLDDAGKKLLGDVFGSIDAQFREVLNTAREANTALTTQVGELMKHVARGKLEGEYPELATAEGFKRAFSRATTLLKARGVYEGDPTEKLVAALEDAAKVEFHDEILAREVDRERARLKRAAERRTSATVPAPSVANASASTDPRVAIFNAQRNGISGEALATFARNLR